MVEEPKQDPFLTESIKFSAGGENFEIKPLPLKKFKEALTIVKTALALVQTAAREDDLAILDGVPRIAMENFLVLAPIVLQRPDLTAEWWEGHISMPLARKILEEVAKINGVMDFLGQTRLGKQLAGAEKESGSPGSTTLSPSPTDGPLKK
jgi:hypothetical protein